MLKNQFKSFRKEIYNIKKYFVILSETIIKCGCEQELERIRGLKQECEDGRVCERGRIRRLGLSHRS